MQIERPESSFDVVQRTLGVDVSRREAARLTGDEVKNVAEHLSHHFVSWQAPNRRADEFRVCIADRVATPRHRDRLSDLVLWVHTVVVRDPLEAWLDDLESSEYQGSEADDLGAAIEMYNRLRPAIDMGAILPAPYPRLITTWGSGDSGYYNDYVRAESNALAAEAGFARGVGVTIRSDRDWRASVQEEDDDPDADPDADLAWRLGERWRASQADVEDVVHKAIPKIERLAQCASTDSRFVPFSASDEAVVEVALPELRRPPSIDDGVFRTLQGVRFPRLDGLRSRDALKVRESEEAFADWRDFLGGVLLDANARAAASSLSLQELVDQELDARLSAARRAVSRSASLRRYAHGEMKVEMTLVTAAAALGVATSSVLPAVLPAFHLLINIVRAGFPKHPDDPPGALLSMVRDP